jgi:hypothetical protein
MYFVSNRWPKIIARAAALLFIVFLGLQFFRPELKNPPVAADLETPPDVKRILKTSCYNCHSNETKLAWFDRIVPAYWLVAQDVKQARSHLNFSELNQLPAAQQKAALFEAVNMIRLGAMPPRQYRLAHPESVVSLEDLSILQRYLSSAATVHVSGAVEIASVEKQYQQWIRSADQRPGIHPSPNGVAFPYDYRDWKAISGTDRYDNQTIRVVLGNDTAIKALEANRITPWPDGSTFAKVAWKEIIDKDGSVRPGEFIQVEFMIKDSRKYASTEGWGWARWRGLDLQPYGKNADFVTECTGCHAPLRSNDFVYSLPIKGRL